MIQNHTLISMFEFNGMRNPIKYYLMQYQLNGVKI